jgi:hypothetical protein
MGNGRIFWRRATAWWRVATLMAIVAASACGHRGVASDGPSVVATKSGPFTDDLAAPDPAGDWPGGLARVIFRDPASEPVFNRLKGVVVVPCGSLQAPTQGLLAHLAVTPAGTRPFCWVFGDPPAGLANGLQHDGSGYWGFTMAYLPTKLDLRTTGGLIALGAIEIGGQFGLPAPQWPSRPYNPRPASGRGGMEPVTVNGHVGNIARKGPKLIDLVWAEPLAAGGWVRWSIAGNQDVLPSRLLDYAQTLQAGAPPDELIPPSYIPPQR